MPPTWPPTVLTALETILTAAIGPLAGPLVRDSAARTADGGELLELLRLGAGADGDNPALLRALWGVLDGANR
jgi:hypothetical protein